MLRPSGGTDTGTCRSRAVRASCVTSVTGRRSPGHQRRSHRMKILTPANRPALYFLALPLLVAMFGFGPWLAVLAIAGGLAWKWGLTLSGIFSARQATAVREEKIVLETIGASHYVEKARWHLDRLGVDYREARSVGGLGIFLTGRSVPRLTLGEGTGQSVIGDSTELLRFLWGRYVGPHPKEAAFLVPSAESLGLEHRLDLYARDVRRWFYFHGINDPAFLLRFWGIDDPGIPRWQRVVVRALLPVLRAFLVKGLGITPEATRKSTNRAHSFLEEMEERLATGGPLMRRGPLHSVDFQFAAFSGPWCDASEYAGAFYSDCYALRLDQYPPSLRHEVTTWREAYPNVVAYVQRLYREERAPRPKLAR